MDSSARNGMKLSLVEVPNVVSDLSWPKKVLLAHILVNKTKLTGGENKLNKLEEYVGSCINWMSLYGFIGAQWHEIKPCWSAECRECPFLIEEGLAIAYISKQNWNWNWCPPLPPRELRVPALSSCCCYLNDISLSPHLFLSLSVSHFYFSLSK